MPGPGGQWYNISGGTERNGRDCWVHLASIVFFWVWKRTNGGRRDLNPSWVIHLLNLASSVLGCWGCGWWPTGCVGNSRGARGWRWLMSIYQKGGRGRLHKLEKACEPLEKHLENGCYWGLIGLTGDKPYQFYFILFWILEYFWIWWGLWWNFRTSPWTTW